MLSFGRPFTQAWPVVFPYGRSSVPLLAPYWNDLDFRNDIEGSGLYYTTYVSSGSKRDEAVLQEFSDRLYDYTDGSSKNFKPRWLTVATWNKASPYYGRSNSDEVSIICIIHCYTILMLSLFLTDTDISSAACYRLSRHLRIFPV